MKRGQIATEYIILVGIVFIALIPIFYYAITTSSKNVNFNEAEDLVNSISKTADRVYALGPGSQDYIQINVPGSTEEIIFDRNEVTVKLLFHEKISDIFARSKTNLTGYISTSSGSKHVYVKTLSNGTVEVGEL